MNCPVCDKRTTRKNSRLLNGHRVHHACMRYTIEGLIKSAVACLERLILLQRDRSRDLYRQHYDAIFRK